MEMLVGKVKNCPEAGYVISTFVVRGVCVIEQSPLKNYIVYILKLEIKLKEAELQILRMQKELEIKSSKL